jgi:hypothetical protein
MPLHITIGGREVDQVDRVNHHRVDAGFVDRLAERHEVVVGVPGRPPRARALVEDLDRVGIPLHAALDGPIEPAGCGNMDPDQHE